MSLKIQNPPDRPITAGHGEYIVYHKDSKTGKITAPDRKTFERAYAITSHLNSPSVDKRYDLIKEKIKAIDPTLEITFVPRTYYELHYLKKCIKEDHAKGEYCENEQHAPDPYAPKSMDCWHIVYFSGEEDNNAEAVKLLAFKMNQDLAKKVSKYLAKQATVHQSAFTFQTITDLTQKQILYFKNFYYNFNWKSGTFLKNYFSEGTPLQKFSPLYTLNVVAANKLSIASDKEETIIQNAIALECHSIAEKSFLFYRGTDFPTDLPYSPNNPNQPYSFSFGSGLFAGALFRIGATAFNYMKDSSDGCVWAIPAQELPHSPFVIPNKNTLCNLGSNNGTVFHPRTRIWKTTESVWGGLPYEELAHFSSDADRETLSDQVLGFKNKNVVFLKSSKNETLALPPAFQPTINIRANVPQGSTLYIRGNGGGLNWTIGEPLVQIEEDLWIYRVSKDFKQLEYKILIDDKLWEESTNNHTLESGNGIEAPSFQVSSKPSSGKSTRLSIRYNAGLGNNLQIVGNGPGLSWSKGTNLTTVGKDLWIWETTDEKFADFEYKVVINDKRWENGPNHRIKYGKKEEVFPHFPI